MQVVDNRYQRQERGLRHVLVDTDSPHNLSVASHGTDVRDRLRIGVFSERVLVVVLNVDLDAQFAQNSVGEGGNGTVARTTEFAGFAVDLKLDSDFSLARLGAGDGVGDYLVWVSGRCVHVVVFAEKRTDLGVGEFQPLELGLVLDCFQEIQLQRPREIEPHILQNHPRRTPLA